MNTESRLRPQESGVPDATGAANRGLPSRAAPTVAPDSRFLTPVSRSALTPDSSRRSAFTLVELLVVILIISILIALLLPALAKARQLALQTACSANIRSLSLATLMYADENNNVLMAQGVTGVEGAYQYYPSTSLLDFFHEYLNVSDRYTSGGTTVTGMAAIEDNVKFHTPGALICPAAPKQPAYGMITYGYMTGSCFPTGPTGGNEYPYAMTVTALQWAGTVARPAVQSGLPALWADLYFVDNPALVWWSGPTRTNHPGADSLTGPGGGGNVGRVDGSVVWMPLSQRLGVLADYHDKYGIYGGWSTIQALPYDTIFLPVDANDNVLNPTESGGPYAITPEGNFYGAFPAAP